MIIVKVKGWEQRPETRLNIPVKTWRTIMNSMDFNVKHFYIKCCDGLCIYQDLHPLKYILQFQKK